MFLVIDIRGVQTVRFESDLTCMLNVKWSLYPGKYRTFCHMSWLLDSLLWSCFADVSYIRRMEAIEIRYGQDVQGCTTRVVHDYSCLYHMENFQDTWLRIVVTLQLIRSSFSLWKKNCTNGIEYITIQIISSRQLIIFSRMNYYLATTSLFSHTKNA